MTLPEIPKEENEQIEQTKTTSCPDCGKQFKNLGVHKRYCKARKDKTAMKQGSSTILPPPPITPAEPKTPKISVSEVQSYCGDEVAWFKDEANIFSRPLLYQGIVDSIPTVLVLLENGMLVPPYTVSGFVGIGEDEDSPRDENTDDEPFPPFPVEEEKEEIKPKTLLEKIEENHPDIVTTKIEKTKKSWWPFGKKKSDSDVLDEAKEDLKEIKSLVEGAINVTE